MNKLPAVMIIADGSRRWSKDNGKSIEYGYKVSAKILASFYDYLHNKVSSLYIPVCTSNNLTNRPPEQIPWYMDAFLSAISLASRPIKFQVVGDFSAVPEYYQQLFIDLEKRYNDPSGIKITYTVGWSSDIEVLRLCKESANNPPKNIDDLIAMSDIKEPIDLIIRSGKVQRLSSLIPLFSPYVELCFINEYFPDMTTFMLESALSDFSKRERRFGGKDS